MFFKFYNRGYCVFLHIFHMQFSIFFSQVATLQEHIYIDTMESHGWSKIFKSQSCFWENYYFFMLSNLKVSIVVVHATK